MITSREVQLLNNRAEDLQDYFLDRGTVATVTEGDSAQDPKVEVQGAEDAHVVVSFEGYYVVREINGRLKFGNPTRSVMEVWSWMMSLR